MRSPCVEVRTRIDPGNVPHQHLEAQVVGVAFERGPSQGEGVFLAAQFGHQPEPELFQRAAGLVVPVLTETWAKLVRDALDSARFKQP